MNEATFWLVYLQFDDGCRKLHRDGLSEAAADKVIADFHASHSKPHKIDYFKKSYTLVTKATVLNEERILI